MFRPFYGLFLGLSLGFMSNLLAQTPKKAPLFSEQQAAEALSLCYTHTLKQARCYDWLYRLCTQIGGRPAGSPQDSAALAFFIQLGQELGADSIWTQSLEVPYWERGNIEKVILELPNGDTLNLAASALGFSGPSKGLRASVVEVQSLAELEKLGRQNVQGKIVFFNRPMDASKINTFHAYGGAVDQRGSGPQKALELGALACLVRSMTLQEDDVPHSGVTSFKSQERLPALALGIQSANKLSQSLKELGDQAQVYLETNCQNLGNRTTHNLIIEIRGSVHPNKILLVGGHLDAWDTGQGAHDDGAGCVQALQVLQTYRDLKLKPRHTLRCVLFAAEEIGIYGGKTYANQAAKDTKNQHILAIESDAGGHTPQGFTLDGLETTLKTGFQKIKTWRPLLLPYGLFLLDPSGSAADIAPLRPLGTLLLGYRPDSQRYFDYHHSAKDRIENVHKRELELGAAAMTALIYLWDTYTP